MTNVSISIVNYSQAAMTIKSVESIRKAVEKSIGKCSVKIWIVDNFSTEADRLELIKGLGLLNNVSILPQESNLGFAGGHNLAVTYILEKDDVDYIWLLNSDCLVDIYALSALLKSAVEYPDVAIWGSTLLEHDGLTIQCAGGCFYNPWLSVFKQYGGNKSRHEVSAMKAPKFDYISGASMFIRGDVFGQLDVVNKSYSAMNKCRQLLNETFFLYFEELDLIQRLPTGFNIAWCKGAVVIHIGGASTGTSNKRKNAVAEYHSNLSALKFTWLYHREKLFVMMPFRFLAKFMQLIWAGQPLLFKETFNAYRDFYRWLKNKNSIKQSDLKP